MSRGIGRAAKAIAEVMKVAMASTAAMVRLIIVMLVMAAIFLGVLWLTNSQGWNLDPFWPSLPSLKETLVATHH